MSYYLYIHTNLCSTVLSSASESVSVLVGLAAIRDTLADKDRVNLRVIVPTESLESPLFGVVSGWKVHCNIIKWRSITYFSLAEAYMKKYLWL